MNFGGLLRVGPRVLHIIAPNRVPAELSVLGSRSPLQVRAVPSKLQRECQCSSNACMSVETPQKVALSSCCG
jgi:hypothetical protein